MTRTVIMILGVLVLIAIAGLVFFNQSSNVQLADATPVVAVEGESSGSGNTGIKVG